MLTALSVTLGASDDCFVGVRNGRWPSGYDALMPADRSSMAATAAGPALRSQ